MTALESPRPLVAWTLALAGAGVALLAGYGCANVLGIEETELIAECVDSDLSYQHGQGTGEGETNLGTEGTDFSCVGGSRPTSDGEDITIRIALARFDGEGAIEGLNVRACKATDVTCATPETETTSDINGDALLTLKTKDVRGNSGFQGYVEITGSGSDGTKFIPYLLYFSEPLIAGDAGDGTTGVFPTFMVQPAELPQKFHSVVGADPSVIPDRGWLVFDGRDCGLKNAPNVRFSVVDACQRMDSKSAEFYFSGGAVSGTTQVTDSVLPFGGFLNLLPDVDVTIQAYWRPAEQDLLVAEKTVVIRAGYLTTMRFEPNLRTSSGSAGSSSGGSGSGGTGGSAAGAGGTGGSAAGAGGTGGSAAGAGGTGGSAGTGG